MLLLMVCIALGMIAFVAFMAAAHRCGRTDVRTGAPSWDNDPSLDDDDIDPLLLL